MNLEEFVKDVLIGLDRGVEGARNKTQRNIHFSTTKDQRTVEFDIAISIEETDTKSGKAGIKVLQFAEAGGNISEENKNSTVSRVKFGVYVDVYTREEERNIRHMEAAQRDSISEY